MTPIKKSIKFLISIRKSSAKTYKNNNKRSNHPKDDQNDQVGG